MIHQTYPFTEQEFQTACVDWNCNCGPSALAFATGEKLDDVRYAIPDFEAKRYTSPTMMKAALAGLDVRYENIRELSVEGMFAPTMALVRIQWHGPWTAPGANPRWAYGHTHWIACWIDDRAQTAMVFDCNCGVVRFGEWDDRVVPELTACIKRADGKWSPTHVWRLTPGS